MTIDGCAGLYEFMGEASVKPVMEYGLRYYDIVSKMPKAGNTKEDIDFKAKYIMQQGLLKEGALAGQAQLSVLIADSAFNEKSNEKSSKDFTSKVNIKKYLREELKKLEDNTVEEFFETMKISDQEEKNKLLKLFDCKSDDKFLKARNNLRKIKDDTQFKNTSDYLDVLIKDAWKNQGTKKILSTFSEKEIKGWKKGQEVLDQKSDSKSDPKYKKWILDYGDPVSVKLKRRDITMVLKDMNKKVISKRAMAPKVGNVKKSVTFADIDNIMANDDFAGITPVDKIKEDAQKKFSNYITAHTGENRVSDDNEKNVEMLSKAMAACLLKGNPENRVYSLKKIHDLAEKLMVSLELKKMEPDKIKNSLMDRHNLIDSIKERTMDIYYPVSDEAKFAEELGSISKSMMSSFDRSPEYQRMAKYAKNIGGLESEYRQTPEGRAEYVENIFNLLMATENYMKIKKGIPPTENGKDRFDNALDILATVRKYIPEARDRVDSLVERTNQIRDVKSSKDKGFVDIEKYGKDRAYKAAVERHKRDSGAKGNDIKNVKLVK